MRNVRAGTPAAPGVIPLPLLPFGPDGVRRSPLHRTHPDKRRITRWEAGVNAVDDAFSAQVKEGLRKEDTADARCPIGGEGGIRTHGAFRLTRSPGARVRPDYATSPICSSILVNSEWSSPIISWGLWNSRDLQHIQVLIDKRLEDQPFPVGRDEPIVIRYRQLCKSWTGEAPPLILRCIILHQVRSRCRQVHW